MSGGSGPVTSTQQRELRERIEPESEPRKREAAGIRVNVRERPDLILPFGGRRGNSRP